jgi:hypothetical protein
MEAVDFLIEDNGGRANRDARVGNLGVTTPVQIGVGCTLGLGPSGGIGCSRGRHDKEESVSVAGRVRLIA